MTTDERTELKIAGLENELISRGGILNKIAAACESGWWHGVIDWINRVVEECRKADSVEGRPSQIPPGLCPAYINQIRKERDLFASMMCAAADVAEHQGKLHDVADSKAQQFVVAIVDHGGCTNHEDGKPMSPDEMIACLVRRTIADAIGEPRPSDHERGDA